jgi:tight adherence protein B
VPALRSLLVAMLLVAMAAALAIAAPAARADDTGCDGVSVTKADTSKFPTVRLQLVRCDSGTSIPRVSIFENGKNVSGARAYNGPIGSYEDNPKPVLMLAIDASESMSPPKIDYAKAAALQLIDQAQKGDRIGVVAFGKRSWVLAQPTDDMTALRAKVEAISLTHGTALYDGVGDAIDAFPSDATRRVVVLLSDGGDTGSKRTQAKVLADAKHADAEVYAVGLEGPGFEPDVLTSLAEGTDGSVQSVHSASQLAGIYQTLGRELLRGWWVEYESGQPGNEAVKLEVTPDGAAPAVFSYTTPTVHGTDGAIKVRPLHDAKPSKPLLHIPGGIVGVLLTALPFALLFGFLGLVLFHGKGPITLAERIAPYTSDPNATSRVKKAASSGDRLEGVYKATEGVLNGSKLFRRFRFLLQQANLPLREVELLYAMVAAAGIGFLLGLLFGGFLWAAVFLVVGAFVPYLYVRFKASRRKKKFESQLADVLGTVAQSLKAGHSFNQSLNAVVKEAPAPTSEEFQRVIAEARLGLPLEEALVAMSQRMDSADFEFAVTAVNIQRTVGGSLSEILDMVADTVRGRQQFRKKVKALVSMGTMSAYVLLAMPVFMALLLSLINPAYMAPLLNTGPGHIMMVGGAVMMVFGYFACMKIVKIKI